jgi:hypothetical protein
MLPGEGPQRPSGRQEHVIVFYFILLWIFLFFLILLPDEGPRRSAGRQEHDLM